MTNRGIEKFKIRIQTYVELGWTLIGVNKLSRDGQRHLNVRRCVQETL